MIPLTDARCTLNHDRIKYWLGVGALPSDRVRVLIKKYGPEGTHLKEQEAAVAQCKAPKVVPDAGTPAVSPSRRSKPMKRPRLRAAKHPPLVWKRRHRRNNCKIQNAECRRFAFCDLSLCILIAMRFDVLTLFPEIFSGYLGQSLLKLAIERGLVDVQLHNIRDWAPGKHKVVDDRPYGGGPGMLLKVEPVVECVEAVQAMAEAQATW